MSKRRVRPSFPAVALLALAAIPAAAQPPDPAGPFQPPPCTGTVFTDVTCSTPFDAWIEQFAADAITAGCGGGKYCPTGLVTRAQMAVFIEEAMKGTANWSPGDRGSNNTALGYHAFYNNTTGAFNSGVGSASLTANVVGHRNTAMGFSSLALTTSSDNTAIGAYSLGWNSTGSPNTAIGWKAGARGGDVVTGYTGSLVTLANSTTGSYNTFLGITGATTQVFNCTAVGMDAYCDANNQVRLGNVFVTSIGGKVGWSALSDARAKSDVRDLDLGLGFVLALHPVSFRYTSGNSRTDMGFLAQDVETLLGDRYNLLDVGGDTDRTLSLRYTDLIAPLVKAVQEQQGQIEARDARIARLEDLGRAQQARMDALEREVQSLLVERTPNLRSREK